MLAADADTAYISEPLNVLHRPGVFRAQVRHWYQYICDGNEGEYLPAFQDLLEYDYFLWDEIRSIRSRKDFFRMGRDFMIFYNALMRGQRALLKDPFAVFSVPWFAKRLNCRVVITVRHPAAFAGSLRRLGWSFDFKDLLDQPLLMSDHLEPYRDQMLSVGRGDVIDQAALLWKLIYSVAQKFRQLSPGWVVVRHEDFSLNPMERYRDLYATLDLEFTARVKKYIEKNSSAGNPTELSPDKTHSVRLDSRATVMNWKKHLNVEDIKRIRDITGETASQYYSDAEW
jgi:hypothetical protein